jgi:hypothetical protein
MNETPFYLTKSGRLFYEVTMPELVRELHQLNEMFALYVELLEKQTVPLSAGGHDGEES